MAAKTNEPINQNFVRKHAIEQAVEFNILVCKDACHVFSNAVGSFSANVRLTIKNGGWDNNQQLQQQFLILKGSVFSTDKSGMMEQQADLFKDTP